MSHEQTRGAPVTSPRTPRQWNAGDPEPGPEVQLLRFQRDLPHPYLRRSLASDDGGLGGWALETHPDPATWSKSLARTWGHRTEQTDLWGPLVEVLPKTPEPLQVSCHGEGGLQGEGPCIPDLWWSPSEKALWEKDNDDGYFCLDYCPIRSSTELPEDAVHLAAAPPAPRVFFPGDTVPAGVRAVNEFGVAFWAGPGDLIAGQELVEIAVPTLQQWQAAVGRAREARADAEWQHTEGMTP